VGEIEYKLLKSGHHGKYRIKLAKQKAGCYG
jgi:hypothetical protein